MVSHKEFTTAGKKPGLQVWRIENLDLKPVPEALHGSFYTGDAYLLLYTTSAPSYCVHMWLGRTPPNARLSGASELPRARAEMAAVVSQRVVSFLSISVFAVRPHQPAPA